MWNTAYVTGLRALAAIRRRDRPASLEQAEDRQEQRQAAKLFNVQWAEAHLPSLDVQKESRNASYIGDAALRARVAPFAKDLRQAAQKVQLANNLLLTSPEQLPSTTWSKQQGERFGLQAYVADGLRWFTISPPRMSEKTRLGSSPRFPDAFLVVLPMSAGKTKVAGDWLAQQGVGQGEKSPKALWVTGQQRLVDDALNPDKTLRGCLPPNTKVTSVWEGHKTEEDTSGDVVIITKDSLEVELQKGLIRPDDYDIVVFDEADIMLSKLKQSVIGHFDASKKLFLTATPSRSVRRDLQRLMHHIRPLSFLEAVEKGVTAPVRILTFLAKDKAHAEQLAASIGFHLFIKEGKKAVAYCQAGGGSAQAKRVAKLTKAHARDALGESDNVYIEMVGSSRPDSADVITHFETAAESGMLATCSMLERGWDPFRLDCCIFVGPQGDYVAKVQKMGRCWRLEPANPDKIAYIVQVKYHTDRNDFTAEMVFGLETVMSGITLGPGFSSGGSATGTRDPAFEQSLAELPEELRAALQPLGRPLAQVLLAPDDPRYNSYVRPEGFDTSISSLVARYPDVPRKWFERQLDIFAYVDPISGEPAKGIPHAKVRNFSPEADLAFERYYDTEGVELFLSQVEVPSVAAGGSLSTRGLAAQLDVPVTLVEAAIRKLGLVKGNELPSDGVARVSRRLDVGEQKLVKDWIHAIPVADDTQEWYADLTRRYGAFASGYFDVRKIKPQLRRHPKESDLNGIGYYINEADAQAMKAEHARITRLTQTHRSLGDMAQRVGTHSSTIARSLTPAEEALLNDPSGLFTPFGFTKPTRHLPNEVADAIEARMLNNVLEAYEVPRDVLGEWLGLAPPHITHLFPSYKLEEKRIGERGKPKAICHLGILKALRDYYQDDERIHSRASEGYRQRVLRMRERLAVFDYYLLPDPGTDMTEDQKSYALTLQRGIFGLPERLLNQFALIGEDREGDTVEVSTPDVSHAIPEKSEVAESTASTQHATDAPSEASWVDTKTAMERLAADEHAFMLFVRGVGLANQDLLYDGASTTLRGVSVQALAKMEEYPVEPPPRDWIRLGMVAKAGTVTPREAFAKLLEIENKRSDALLQRPFGPQEWRLGRNGLKVEVYVHPTIARHAQRELIARRKEHATTKGRKS